jgi:hypothetical protein
MAAWFRQLGDAGHDLRNVGVFCLVDHARPQFENFESKKAVWEDMCAAPLRGLFDSWVVCMPQRSEGAGFNVLSRDVLKVRHERRARRAELELIRKQLTSVGVDPAEVAEIWYGNGKFDQHIFHLCPNANGICFEHGLSDVRNAVVHNTNTICSELPIGWCPPVLIRPLRAIRETLNRRAVFFSRGVLRRDQHVSLLAEEIAAANPGVNMGAIEPESILSISREVVESGGAKDRLAKLAHPTALVLVESLCSQAGKHDTLAFYRDLDRFLLEHCGEALRKAAIKSIVFKTRFFEQTFAPEVLACMCKLGAEYDCSLLSDLSPMNYPAEYYLSLVRPKMVIGSHSSALFYAKKLFPELWTCSYHHWYLDRCRSCFGGRSRIFRWLDYEHRWQESIFHGAHRRCFKGVLPELLVH